MIRRSNDFLKLVELLAPDDLLSFSSAGGIEALTLARLRANKRLVSLPPLVCLKSAVFSSWKTPKFCASSGEQGGGTCVETPRF
jgi:hypothetical protein